MTKGYYPFMIVHRGIQKMSEFQWLMSSKILWNFGAVLAGARICSILDCLKHTNLEAAHPFLKQATFF
jgi:pheromone shutdown protein TraB